LIASRRRIPTLADRPSIASTAPNTPTPSAICWRSRSMAGRCSRLTGRATASTTSAMRCQSRPDCWSGISWRPRRSVAARSV